MQPDPANLLEIAGITVPPIGFYDLPDPNPFEPFAKPKRCIFSAYENWLAGESICLTEGSCACRGGSYWIGGAEFATRAEFARTLNEREGFKSSAELMEQWLENLEPYRIKNGTVVIGPLREDQYDFLKTVTFFVNPDQLSLLLLGTEYNNASVNAHPAIAAFGSGCGQMAALPGAFDPDTPKAVIGATDVAMREHLPPDVLALTVNKPMFEQLCELDENSFLYKSFWQRLKMARREQQRA